MANAFSTCLDMQGLCGNSVVGAAAPGWVRGVIRAGINTMDDPENCMKARLASVLSTRVEWWCRRY